MEAPKGGARRVGGAKGGAPKGGETKISRFFYPFRLHVRSFCLSLGVFSLKFWWLCEAPGLHTTVREPERAHFRSRSSKIPPKFHETTPKRGRRTIMASGEGKKRAKFSTVRSTPNNTKQHQTTPNNNHNTTTTTQQPQHNNHNTTTTHNKTKMYWPKWAKPLTTNFCQNGLAKMGWPKVDWLKSATTVVCFVVVCFVVVCCVVVCCVVVCCVVVCCVVVCCVVVCCGVV